MGRSQLAEVPKNTRPQPYVRRTNCSACQWNNMFSPKHFIVGKIWTDLSPPCTLFNIPMLAKIPLKHGSSMENNTQMEPRGFEPLTSSVQGRRSPNLNYGPSDLRPSGQAPYSTYYNTNEQVYLLVHLFVHN